MPTPTGAETISERLKRLRSELVRVRQTVERAENNGQSNQVNGTMITEVSYERALRRRRELESEITALEARLAGSQARPGLAQIAVKFD